MAGATRRIAGALAALGAVLAAAAPASAAPEPQPFRTNDGRGFYNVLPPGQSGHVNGAQLLQFLSTGARPPHNDEQLRMYGDLVYASPGLSKADLLKYFKDASFGVRPDEEEVRYSPRDDVTIVRDERFGRPSVYGENRDGAMFGLGYVAAQDRLFFIDVLRHLGRAQLSSFVGGAPGNRAFDRDQWAIAPYTEDDLQHQIELLPKLYGRDGEIVRRDAENYVAGVNKYIAEAKLDPTKMPGEYGAINRPQGPDEWKLTDIVATAALVGGVFGKGGGNELGSATVLAEAQRRFGEEKGARVWADFRSAEDPEAPTTVQGRRFPYQVPDRKPKGRALPDRGTLEYSELSQGGPLAARRTGCAAGGLVCLPRAGSNALFVSARESKSGRPLAVAGPQAGYFAPQILMDQDVHAPEAPGLPGIDATGAAFPGVNLYVQLGRGRDYVFSATSAGQDNIDTYAMRLCNQDGRPPTLQSQGYMYKGGCRAIEPVVRTNTWAPSAADQTPAGSETLRAERTALGLVVARALVKGVPVVYTSLRSTYFHEVDSAPGFVDFNDPEKMDTPREFMRSASKIGYTFNWLYANDRQIAYFNSGNNPVRPSRADTNFPVWGSPKYLWRDWSPDFWTADYTPSSQHPQVVDQAFLTSWNNKQAPGYRASDSNFGFSSTYRSKTLDDRIKRGIAGSRRMSLVQLIDAMEDAGTVDLRGDAVLPYALMVLGNQSDPALAGAIAKLRAWVEDGAHRRDRNRDGTYEHSDAIRIMDAWWPLLLEAEFKPTLGKTLFEAIQRMQEFDNAPNNHGQHLGSAYQGGWYGFARKDLRTILGGRVRGRYSRVYCGKGKLSACREALAESLREAVATPASEVYQDAGCADGDQWCFDAVRFRPLGGVTQPPIHWINRPTFQQAAEIKGSAP